MRTIAFYINPQEDWMGGVNYYKNLFSAISLIKNNEFIYILFLPLQAKKFEFENYFKWKIIYDDSLLTNFNSKLNEYIEIHDIDILSHMNIYINVFPCKICNWIPDFQHLHLPHLFSEDDLKLRNRIFKEYTNVSDIVFLSSKDAYNDFIKFIPESYHKGKVLNFVANIDFSFLDDIKILLPENLLNEDFFYLPNQFWLHKNHIVVFKAIKYLKDKNIKIKVVCSGSTKDPRNEKHFNDLINYLKSNKLENNVIFLGIIPQKTVYALMNIAKAVINPSLFEGWSSTVEECKTLNKHIILSDIDVHKEQISDYNIEFVHLFKATNYRNLSKILTKVLKTSTKSQKNQSLLKKELSNNMLNFGLSYEKILKENINQIEKDKLKITIVTVTYNAEKYLERTIQSITNQTYTNIEYIIIDGGSSDKTIEIIKRYKNNITYWESEPDKGIYDAMNKGIDKATGEWINFLNAGDTYTHNKILNNIFNKFDTQNIDAIYGGVNVVDDKNLIKNYFNPNNLDNFINNYSCNHQTLFVKTAIHKENKFNLTYKTSADVDLILKLYRKNHSFKMLDLPIVNYLDGGFSKENHTLQLIELMHIFYIYKIKNHSIYDSYPFKFLINTITEENNLFFYDLEKDYLTKIKKLFLNKKIVLYGYGKHGRLIYENFKENIVFIVDQNYKNLNINNKEIQINNPETLSSLKFDYLFIGIPRKEKIIEDYIKNTLRVNNIKILKLEGSK